MAHEYEIDDLALDAKIDRWNDGAFDALTGKPQESDNVDYLEGYVHGLDQRKVRPVMLERPEGYYHVAPGSFD